MGAHLARALAGTEAAAAIAGGSPENKPAHRRSGSHRFCPLGRPVTIARRGVSGARVEANRPTGLRAHPRQRVGTAEERLADVLLVRFSQAGPKATCVPRVTGNRLYAF
jgi:hypothetical protein